MRLSSYTPHRPIRKRGAFFLIDSGEATLSSKGILVAIPCPGNYFGEIALIYGSPAQPRRARSDGPYRPECLRFSAFRRQHFCQAAFRAAASSPTVSWT
jgi:CRP-like cAMP-binding protein